MRDVNNFRLAAVAGSLLLAGGIACGGEAQSPSSHSAAPREATNAPSAVPRPSELNKDGLQRLEEQLSRALQVFAPKGGMEGWRSPAPRPPAPRSVAPTRRLQERLDQERNWILLTPEDAAKAPTADEMLGLTEREKDQRERSKASALERLYEKLGRGPEEERSKNQKFEELLDETRIATAEDQRREEEQKQKTPETVREREEALRRLLATDDYSPATATRETRVFDTLGLGSPATGREDRREPNRYVQQYREFFDGGAAAAADPLASFKPNPGGSLASPVYAPRMDSLLTAPARSPSQAPNLNPALVPPATPDINRQTVNDWNPYYTPPQVETKRFTVPRPNFDAPRRNF